MTLRNVRMHWKGLAVVALAFVFIAALGPVVLFGLPWLFEVVRGVNPWLALLIIPVLIVGYVIGAYAVVRRADTGVKLPNSENSNG